MRAKTTSGGQCMPWRSVPVSTELYAKPWRVRNRTRGNRSFASLLPCGLNTSRKRLVRWPTTGGASWTWQSKVGRYSFRHDAFAERPAAGWERAVLWPTECWSGPQSCLSACASDKRRASCRAPREIHRASPRCCVMVCGRVRNTFSPLLHAAGACMCKGPPFEQTPPNADRALICSE